MRRHSGHCVARFDLFWSLSVVPTSRRVSVHTCTDSPRMDDPECGRHRAVPQTYWVIETAMAWLRKLPGGGGKELVCRL